VLATLEDYMWCKLSLVSTASSGAGGLAGFGNPGAPAQLKRLRLQACCLCTCWRRASSMV
jgi:hypothetical protein